MRHPPRGPYANRLRGVREKAAPGAADGLPAIIPAMAGADRDHPPVGTAVRTAHTVRQPGREPADAHSPPLARQGSEA